MSQLDSQNQNGKRSRETSEVLDTVFDFLMDFANKAETIVPQHKRRTIDVDDATCGTDEEEEPSDDGVDVAEELFGKLPVGDKEELLMDVFGGIVGNMLDKLPNEGKEEFLLRCFGGLFPKLPSDSQIEIESKLKGVSSQSQGALAISSTPESPRTFPNLFPAGDLDEAGLRVEHGTVKPPSRGERNYVGRPQTTGRPKDKKRTARRIVGASP